MDIKEVEALFEAKLDPVRNAIEKLEKGQEQMLKVLLVQERQDERIMTLQKQIEKCSQGQNGIYNRIREVEKTTVEKTQEIEEKIGNRTWDMLKIAITAAISAAIGVFFGKSIK